MKKDKIKVMKIKEIREILMTEEVKFTVKGLTDYSKNPKVFRTMNDHNGTESIWVDDEFQGMNVNKFGPTCVTLFTYDMLDRKIVGKIKYEDVTIIK
jgi:hypothetical protein